MTRDFLESHGVLAFNVMAGGACQERSRRDTPSRKILQRFLYAVEECREALADFFPVTAFHELRCEDTCPEG